jgi:hypothetical protein
MRTGWYPFAIARDGALSYLTVGISPLAAVRGIGVSFPPGSAS